MAALSSKGGGAASSTCSRRSPRDALPRVGNRQLRSPLESGASESLHQPLDLTPALVERRSSPGAVEIKLCGKCSLIQRLSVASVHVPAQPFLGPAYLFGIRGGSHVTRQTSITRQRLDRGDEPRLELALRQNHLCGHITSCMFGALHELRSQLGWTILVSVYQHQHSTSWPAKAASEFDRPLEFPGSQELAFRNSDRSSDFRGASGVKDPHDPTNQDRDGLAIPVPLDDRRHLKRHRVRSYRKA